MQALGYKERFFYGKTSLSQEGQASNVIRNLESEFADWYDIPTWCSIKLASPEITKIVNSQKKTASVDKSRESISSMFSNNFRNFIFQK